MDNFGCQHTDYSLLANILVSNFIEQFKSEIGLKSLTISGSCFFGIKVIKELLMDYKLALP
jgi:hypothetical protein